MNVDSNVSTCSLVGQLKNIVDIFLEALKWSFGTVLIMAYCAATYICGFFNFKERLEHCTKPFNFHEGYSNFKIGVLFL
jgi:hypothetical protein